jgi:hypothetical protein
MPNSIWRYIAVPEQGELIDQIKAMTREQRIIFLAQMGMKIVNLETGLAELQGVANGSGDSQRNEE